MLDPLYINNFKLMHIKLHLDSLLNSTLSLELTYVRKLDCRPLSKLSYFL
jgi:hypothetical protein